MYPALPGPAPKTKNTTAIFLAICIFVSVLAFSGSLAYYAYTLQDQTSFNELVITSKPQQAAINLDLGDPINLSKNLAELNLTTSVANAEFSFDSKPNTTYTTTPSVDPTLYKTFDGDEFKEFYNNFEYQKVQPIKTKPDIKNNAQANEIILTEAEKRGYLLRAIAETSTLVTADGLQLQFEAKTAWQVMKSQAAKDGIKLTLTSGFRSVDNQKEIFLNRLGPISNEEIIAKSATAKITEVLTRTAPPGYSRHHSGYTIDISCDGVGLERFKETECFKWISAFNYLNAKRFGFIPSYPDDANNQGPEPEQWEYVWVGEQNLRKTSLQTTEEENGQGAEDEDTNLDSSSSSSLSSGAD